MGNDDEKLQCALIDRLVEQGVKGGQRPDGSQKDGFLSYEKGRIKGIWDPEKQEYISADQLESEVAFDLGDLPEGHFPWKAIIGDPDKAAKFENYFSSMRKADNPGAKLAVAYGKNSADFGQLLVDKKVAASTDDVNTVLLTGFFHAYGPVNTYFS